MVTLALLTVGTALGAMLFFSFVMAPTVFKTLPADHAGRLIRSLFPRYYLTLALATAIAAVSGWSVDTLAGLLAILVTAGFVLAHQVLMPKINRLRDLAAAGDSSADRRFKQWHLASVMVNMLQLILLAVAFGRLVYVN